MSLQTRLSPDECGKLSLPYETKLLWLKSFYEVIRVLSLTSLIFCSTSVSSTLLVYCLTQDIFVSLSLSLYIYIYVYIVVSEDPGGNLSLRTNINAQQNTCNKAMICKRNKFINRTNVSLRLATSSECEWIKQVSYLQS